MDEAQFFLEEYQRVVSAIIDNNLDSNLSIKQTAFGLLLDKDKGMENIEAIVNWHNDMTCSRLDMEDHRVTDDTIQVMLICMKKV